MGRDRGAATSVPRDRESARRRGSRGRPSAPRAAGRPTRAPSPRPAPARPARPPQAPAAPTASRTASGLPSRVSSSGSARHPTTPPRTPLCRCPQQIRKTQKVFSLDRKVERRHFYPAVSAAFTDRKRQCRSSSLAHVDRPLQTLLTDALLPRTQFTPPCSQGPPHGGVYVRHARSTTLRSFSSCIVSPFQHVDCAYWTRRAISPCPSFAPLSHLQSTGVLGDGSRLAPRHRHSYGIAARSGRYESGAHVGLRRAQWGRR
jgi:hypothetical protein